MFALDGPFAVAEEIGCLLTCSVYSTGWNIREEGLHLTATNVPFSSLILCFIISSCVGVSVVPGEATKQKGG